MFEVGYKHYTYTFFSIGLHENDWLNFAISPCEIIFDVFVSFCKLITFFEINGTDTHPHNFDISEKVFSFSKVGCFQILIGHNIYQMSVLM